MLSPSCGGVDVVTITLVGDMPFDVVSAGDILLDFDVFVLIVDESATFGLRNLQIVEQMGFLLFILGIACAIRYCNEKTSEYRFILNSK